MFRGALKTGLAANFIFNSNINIEDTDRVSGATKTEQKANISIVHNESGWDRLKRMFETDEFGNLSKELVSILHVGCMSSFVGALYGGVIQSRDAYVDFIKNNQATAFNDHFDAKKRLQDKVTLSFGRGAWKWGWRLTLFCTTFTGIATVISVYRGKVGMVEYVSAGAASGILYKFNMGPRGWLVGGGLGAALGLIAGGSTLTLLKISGVSMDEIRYWQYHWRQDRANYIHQGITDLIKNEELEIIKRHDERVGDAGKTLDNLGTATADANKQ